MTLFDMGWSNNKAIQVGEQKTKTKDMDPVNQDLNRTSVKIIKFKKRIWEDGMMPSPLLLFTYKPYFDYSSHQTDGCTINDETEETFNEQEAGWGLFELSHGW